MRRLRRLLHRLRDEFFSASDDFDRAHAVKTSGRVWRWRYDVPWASRKTAVSYQPVDPDIFARAVRHLPPETRDGLFLDLGCGKGRALLLARESGFKRIVGVEFSRALAKVARKNVKGLGEVTVMDEDATKYEFEKMGHVTIFMYNPFGPEILERVVENLRSKGVTGFVVYVKPMHDSVLAERGMNLLHRENAFSVWRI
jgi:SAM-dependent methyltransferase